MAKKPKITLASLPQVDWDKIKAWIEACNAKTKEIIDRCDDVTVGFFAAVLLDKSEKEKAAAIINDRAKFEIGYNAGLLLAPWVKPLVMTWLMGILGAAKK